MPDDACRTTGYVIAPLPRTTLPVVGSELHFPVNRVFCIGRNYAAHAVEMGHDPNREPPFFFLKSPTNLAIDGRFPYPTQSSDVHHEIELMVVLAKGGAGILEDEALSHVWGYGVGLDMTRRDLQDVAKKMGRPWEVAKSFERSAPCGPLSPATAIGHPTSGAVTLDVNGERRQTGDLNQMIWKVPEIISELSRYFELQSGDVIMTGTPSGVGAVRKGDILSGNIEGVGSLSVEVV